VQELAEYATLILEKTMNREFTLTPGAEFAPVRRSAFTEVKDDFKRICACELVAPILDAMGEPAALLNENRQVVFANTAMCELGGVVAREEILGLRLGEVLGCDLALNRPGGCGTYRECRSCGAINAVLAALDGRSVTNNASVEVNRAGMERTTQFRIAATPVPREQRDYVLVVFSELSVR
jgi:PAS domain-containing protein